MTLNFFIHIKKTKTLKIKLKYVGLPYILNKFTDDHLEVFGIGILIIAVPIPNINFP